MPDFACVVLVDRRGWVLLQERDEHPVVDPEKWGYPGGGIELGESAERAAYRELAEEFSLYAAATDVTDLTSSAAAPLPDFLVSAAYARACTAHPDRRTARPGVDRRRVGLSGREHEPGRAP